MLRVAVTHSPHGSDGGSPGLLHGWSGSRYVRRPLLGSDPCTLRSCKEIQTHNHKAADKKRVTHRTHSVQDLLDQCFLTLICLQAVIVLARNEKSPSFTPFVCAIFVLQNTFLGTDHLWHHKGQWHLSQVRDSTPSQVFVYHSETATLFLPPFKQLEGKNKASVLARS